MNKSTAKLEMASEFIWEEDPSFGIHSKGDKSTNEAVWAPLPTATNSSAFVEAIRTALAKQR